MTAGILDDLLARKTVSGRPAGLEDDLAWVRPHREGPTTPTLDGRSSDDLRPLRRRMGERRRRSVVRHGLGAFTWADHGSGPGWLGVDAVLGPADKVRDEGGVGGDHADVVAARIGAVVDRAALGAALLRVAAWAEGSTRASVSPWASSSGALIGPESNSSDPTIDTNTSGSARQRTAISLIWIRAAGRM